MEKDEMLCIINERSRFNIHNGIRVVDVGDDYCVTEGELREEALNPRGMAHGGFIYSLCDVAAGVAVSQLVRKCVTMSGNVYFLRPSKGKYLRAEAKIIKNGRTVVLAETNVYNDEGVHTARGEFELYIIEDKR